MLPMSMKFLIPENHGVRIVNDAIDEMNLELLFAKYPGGGRSSLNPLIMTKLIVYAYIGRISLAAKYPKLHVKT